jgi:hypothetical protein
LIGGFGAATVGGDIAGLGTNAGFVMRAIDPLLFALGGFAIGRNK